MKFCNRLYNPTFTQLAQHQARTISFLFLDIPQSTILGHCVTNNFPEPVMFK